ncbi:MAG: hypothetical protein GXP46_13830 [Deferribacteres bacterium]|nr:hypothetical protein [Deferribacteres bacterium]
MIRTIRRGIPAILLAMLLFGCSSEQPAVKDASETGSRTPAVQAPAAKKSAIVIGPPSATRQSIISLSADRAILKDAEINWYVNDIKVESAKGTRFTSDELRKGDIVRAVVVKGKKELPSNEIIIKNTPPVTLRAELSPAMPRANSTIIVDIKTSDIDGDNITFKYKWTVNGKFAGEEEFLDGDLKRGDIITVEVTPFDGEDYGKTIRLNTKVFNSVPVFSARKPYLEGNTYKYQITATDPDGDELTYALKEAPEGMSIDPATGMITWNVTSKDEGVYDVKVSISDNNGGEIIVPFSTRISFAGEAE